MFFELKTVGITLVGLIGKDGRIYWKSDVIAKFLLFKAIDYFVKKYSITTVNDVAFEYIKKTFGKRLLKSKIISHDSMVTLLRKRRKTRFRYDELKDEDFYVIVWPGKKHFWPELRFSYEDEIGAISFSSWIDSYKKEVEDGNKLKSLLLTQKPFQFNPDSYSMPSPEYSPTDPYCEFSNPSGYSPYCGSSKPSPQPSRSVVQTPITRDTICPHCPSKHSSNCFLLWMDGFPPSKFSTFYNNEYKTFVEL